MTLIETPTYKSSLSDGHYTVRLTQNGGVTFTVVTLDLNAFPAERVEGDLDDVRAIIADCADIPIDEVDSYCFIEFGGNQHDFLRAQCEYELDIRTSRDCF